MKGRISLTELIQTGILATLLTIAYQVGQFSKEIKMTVKDHEKRITKIENKVLN